MIQRPIVIPKKMLSYCLYKIQTAFNTVLNAECDTTANPSSLTSSSSILRRSDSHCDVLKRFRGRNLSSDGAVAPRRWRFRRHHSMIYNRFLVARVLPGGIQAACIYYQEGTATGLFSFLEFRGVLQMTSINFMVVSTSLRLYDLPSLGYRVLDSQLIVL
ncbi:Uncharacterized protein HZ326_31036 [Fusarium oxysporum f. sp. albedinis]|nr:Uncharacterized protein HZ326_31036 [Fusarium oxysporum f. sp. albedinis]